MVPVFLLCSFSVYTCSILTNSEESGIFRQTIGSNEDYEIWKPYDRFNFTFVHGDDFLENFFIHKGQKYYNSETGYFDTVVYKISREDIERCLEKYTWNHYFFSITLDIKSYQLDDFDHLEKLWFDGTSCINKKVYFEILPDDYSLEQLRLFFHCVLCKNLRMIRETIEKDGELEEKLIRKYNGKVKLHHFESITQALIYMKHNIEILTTQENFDLLIDFNEFYRSEQLKRNYTARKTVELISDLNNLCKAIKGINSPESISFETLKTIPDIKGTFVTGTFYSFTKNQEMLKCNDDKKYKLKVFNESNNEVYLKQVDHLFYQRSLFISCEEHKKHKIRSVQLIELDSGRKTDTHCTLEKQKTIKTNE